MTLRRSEKIILIVFQIVTFFGLYPLSIRLADPLFTHPFHPDWEHPVLLVWPDHIEIRWFRDVAEVSPRPKGGDYTFNVLPERQAWVEQQARNTASPTGKAAWVIHVKQLGPVRQKIQLELLGDGICGIVYEAKPDEIVPLRSRLTGPGGAFIVLAVHLLLWGGFWHLVWRVARRVARRRVEMTL